MFLYALAAIALSFIIFLVVGINDVMWMLNVFTITLILIVGAYKTAQEKKLIPSDYLRTNPEIVTLITVVVSILGGIAIFLGYFAYKNAYGPMGFITVMVFIISSLVEIAAGNRVSGAVFSVLAILTGVIFTPIFAAWGPVAHSKAIEAGTSIDIGTRASAGWEVLKYYFNDTWTALTNPNYWYQKQFVTSGRREEGATSLGVEIEKVEVIPAKPFASVITDSKQAEDQEAKILVTVVNKGKKKEQTGNDVSVIVGLDKYAVDKGARLKNNDGTLSTIAWKSYDKIYPGTSVYASFDMLTPFCAGTFKLNTILQYRYNTSALFTIEFMDYYYFNELLKRKKVTRERKYSISSAGPFKITMQTELQPVLVKNGVSENFTLFITVQNEREGNAMVDFLKVYVPEDVEIMDPEACGWELQPNSDIDGYKLYNIIKPIESEEQHGEGDKVKRCILGKQIRLYHCKARFKRDVVDSEQRTFLVKFGYHYQYEKSLSFSTTTLFPKTDACTLITEKDIPESRKIEKWDEYFNNSCLYSRKDRNRYFCSVKGIDNAIKLLSGLVEKCAEMEYLSSAEEKECVEVKLDILDVRCDESKIVNATTLKEGFENEGSNEEQSTLPLVSRFIDVTVDNKVDTTDKSSISISSAFMYDIKVTYARGLCGIGSRVKLTLLSKQKDLYECNLPNRYPCKDNSQCLSGNCNDAYKYLLARRSESSDMVSYEELMDSTDDFLRGFLTIHSLSIPREAMEKLSYENYKYYQFWNNPEIKDRNGNYILPYQLRTFIKRMKPYLSWIDFNHKLESSTDVWTFLPSLKVCQPAECTYDRDTSSGSVEFFSGCACPRPYVSGRYVYPGFNSEYRCIPLCAENAFVSTEKCLCAPHEWYTSLDGSSQINFRLLDERAARAYVLEKSKILSSCSSENVGKSATICCIFSDKYGNYPGKVTATCQNITYEDEEGNKHWKLVWMVRYTDSGVYVYDELPGAYQPNEICNSLKQKISEQLSESPETRKPVPS